MNENVIPIVVGADKECVLKSRELYGGKIHIFDERCSIFKRMCPYFKFHRTVGRMPTTVARFINDFAEENPDYLPVVMFGADFSDRASEIIPLIDANCIIWREDLKL